jgi:hypothetical protein
MVKIARLTGNGRVISAYHRKSGGHLIGVVICNSMRPSKGDRHFDRARRMRDASNENHLVRAMTEQGLIIRFDRPVAFADRFSHGFNIDDLNFTS